MGASGERVGVCHLGQFSGCEWRRQTPSNMIFGPKNTHAAARPPVFLPRDPGVGGARTHSTSGRGLARRRSAPEAREKTRASSRGGAKDVNFDTQATDHPDPGALLAHCTRLSYPFPRQEPRSQARGSVEGAQSAMPTPGHEGGSATVGGRGLGGGDAPLRRATPTGAALLARDDGT